VSGVVTEPAATPTRPGWRLAVRLLGFLAGSLALGAAAGVVWWLVVRPPAYELNSNGGATTTERGLAEFIAGDAWFCAIGLVAGLLIGLALAAHPRLDRGTGGARLRGGIGSDLLAGWLPSRPG
jgi:hypothetical protein